MDNKANIKSKHNTNANINSKYFKNNHNVNNTPKNINAIIDLERLKGEKINNISQYNNAMQRQVIQNQQKMQILKYQNSNQNQNAISKIKDINFTDCNCE